MKNTKKETKMQSILRIKKGKSATIHNIYILVSYISEKNLDPYTLSFPRNVRKREMSFLLVLSLLFFIYICY